MSSLLPILLRPYWLLLLPLLLWLVWRLWQRERRLGRWQTLLPEAFHPVLLSGGKGQAGRLRWLLLGIAWLLAVLALIGPSWQRVEQTQIKPIAPLVVIMDLTPRMLAEDAAPNRLEQARRKVLDLLQMRQDAQTALLVYAGSAHTLVPLSNDLSTSRNLLDSIKPSIMPEPGTRADLAVQRALDLLDQGASGQGRILLITNSLNDEEQEGIRQALKNRPERLDILGIGSREGVPIRNENGGFLKNEDGSILLPKLDSNGLTQLARSVGGQYRNLRIDDSDLSALGLELSQAQMHNSEEPLQLTRWLDQGYWFLLPLLLLAACAGRRGWLFIALLAVSLPHPAYAFSFDDLWWRADQQGMQLLEQNRPAEAAQRFENRQWQGIALFENADYDEAAERFAEDDSAQGHYNRGNALAYAQHYEAAIDAYDQALDKQPEFPEARHNKALIEELLRQQQEQQQSSDDNAEPEQDNSSNNEGQSAPNAASGNQNNEPKDGQTESSGASQEASNEQEGSSEQPQSQQSNQQPAATSEQTRAEEQSPPSMGQAEPAQGLPAENAGEELLESQQAREQWLRQVPDDPAELLRRKFWYEQQQRQEQNR